MRWLLVTLCLIALVSCTSPPSTTFNESLLLNSTNSAENQSQNSNSTSNESLLLNSSNQSENQSQNDSVRCIATGDYFPMCNLQTGERKGVPGYSNCGGDVGELSSKGWVKCWELSHLSFQTIMDQRILYHPKAENLVIRNDTAWKELLNNSPAMVVSPEFTNPEINFSKEMVLAAFGGEHSSGGYRIQIIQVNDRPYFVEVTINSTAPQAGQPVTAAFTYPYHIVKVPRIDKPVRFTDGTPRICTGQCQSSWMLQDNGTCIHACAPCAEIDRIEFFPTQKQCLAATNLTVE